MRYLICLSIILCGCAHHESLTAITTEVRDAGGGDPRVVSVDAMRMWFIRHAGFAGHIAAECKGVEDHPLGWVEGTEGRVCMAAQDAAYIANMPRAYHDNIGW
jgi:hypothetical protein